jgi:hypothetical protein
VLSSLPYCLNKCQTTNYWLLKVREYHIRDYLIYVLNSDQLVGCLICTIYIFFSGNKNASNHLILPCYRPVFFSLSIVFALQFVFITVLYCLVQVKETMDQDILMLSIFYCSTFLQIPYSISPLLLWVTSLSRSGFLKVGSLLLPCFFISIILLACLLVFQNMTILICLLLLTCIPSIFLSVGILSKRLHSRVEVRSRSSRSSSEFLLVYSVLVVCFGSMFIADKSSSPGIIGLGVAVFLNTLFPLTLYRTLNADTKFWRGLGQHNQGGISSPNGTADALVAEAVTLGVASTHLQTVMSDLSRLMIDFAHIEIGAVIGTGSSSSVYKAEYRETKVAIKVLNPPEITEEELLSIREETCINSIMAHPCIVEIIGICVRPPEIGIVMEYCQKGTLKHSLQNNAQEWTALRRLCAVADLAKAVAHVHGKGYMHRYCLIVGVATCNMYDDVCLCTIICTIVLNIFVIEGISKLKICSSLTNGRPNLEILENHEQ